MKCFRIYVVLTETVLFLFSSSESPGRLSGDENPELWFYVLRYSETQPEMEGSEATSYIQMLKKKRCLTKTVRFRPKACPREQNPVSRNPRTNMQESCRLEAVPPTSE